MELTLKQKIIVFAVMLAIFMGSVFLKQWLDKKDYDENLSGSGNKIEKEIQSEEKSKEKDSSSENSDENESEVSEEDLIIIDVEGAVTYPGIVKIKEGSRVYEAVEEAGGILDNADTKYVNLAEELKDGTNIYIPFKGENGSSGASSGNAGSTGSTNTGSGSDLININTADQTKLMELPGIGETYAQAIINYRKENGNFKDKEDIKEVSGIGDATYAKLKDLICVY